MTNKFDFNSPLKRPSPIISAMGAAADEAAIGAAIGASMESPAQPALIAGMTPEQLNAAVREAALVIPGKQAVREIANNLAADLDAHLDSAIRTALKLGPDADVVAAMEQGHTWELVPDGAFDDAGAFIPMDERGETYVLDGEPLLWAGPVELTRTDNGDDVQVRGQRKIRHYAVAADSGQLTDETDSA